MEQSFRTLYRGGREGGLKFANSTFAGSRNVESNVKGGGKVVSRPQFGKYFGLSMQELAGALLAAYQN